MELYRKKPVVVQAEEIKEVIHIKTLEGVMIGNVGDFLITGVHGEKYPCKPEIFHKTYEKVDQSGNSVDPYEEIDDLESQIEDLRDNYESLEDELSVMEGERDEYYVELQEARESIEELKSYLLHVSFDLEDALVEIEDLKEKYGDEE